MEKNKLTIDSVLLKILHNIVDVEYIQDAHEQNKLILKEWTRQCCDYTQDKIWESVSEKDKIYTCYYPEEIREK